MWNPGDVIAGRGVFRDRVWSAHAIIVVNDNLKEIAAALLPGAESRMEASYSKAGKSGKRRWDFIHTDWQLTPFLSQTQRALVLFEPNQFFSIRLFWEKDRDKFLGYYVNFQLPFRVSHCGIDSLDLELDIVVKPDLSFEWKDLDDYQKGIETGVILAEWTDEIEIAKREILGRIETRQYPFDGSWAGWMPDPNWSPPKLPENWDKV